MTTVEITDFELKDSRDYVNSTSMLDRVCAVIDAQVKPAATWSQPTIEANFRKIASFNGPLLVTCEKGEFRVPDPVSDFTFRDGDATIRAWLAQDSRLTPQRRIATAPAVRALELTGEFAGRAEVGCATLSEFFEAVIEANKQIHLMTLPGRKIRVINMRMKEVPLWLPRLGQPWLRLTIANVSRRETAAGIATVNELTFDGTGIPPALFFYLVAEPAR